MENNMSNQYVIYTKNIVGNILTLTKNLSQLHKYDKYIITVNGLSMLFARTSQNAYKVTIANAPLDLKIENHTDFILTYDYSNFSLFNFDNVKVVINNIKSSNQKKQPPIIISSAEPQNKISLINNDNQVLNYDDIFLKMIFIKNIKYYSNIVKNNSTKEYGKMQKCCACNANKICFCTNDNMNMCTKCIVDRYFRL